MVMRPSLIYFSMRLSPLLVAIPFIAKNVETGEDLQYRPQDTFFANLDYRFLGFIGKLIIIASQDLTIRTQQKVISMDMIL